jgi:hypothetical protein
VFGFNDAYSQHVLAVDALADAGISPPEEWTTLRDNFNQFASDELTEDVIGQLTDAIAAGKLKEVPKLHSLALGRMAASSQDAASVTNDVKAHITRRLFDVYAPCAETNYAKAAQTFDHWCAVFTAACNAVDPESPAESIVALDDDQRHAWTVAQEAKFQLSGSLEVLKAAAKLCGHDAAGSREYGPPLACDTSGHHRRRLWEAWDSTEGRTGRWGALHAMGVTIRAANLDAIEPYRLPQPMEERWKKVGVGHQRVMVDPEDASVPADATA